MMNTHLEMEQVLNYLTKLAQALLANGSTLEHVEYAIEKNAEAYQLTELSTVMTHQYVSICFRGTDGNTYTKQLGIFGITINLENLRVLNNIMHQVANHPIPTEQLQNVLDQVENTRKYNLITTVLCQVLAITSVCFILGGKPRDMISTALVSFCLFWINRALSKLRTDKIINNIVSMFLGTVLAFLLVKVGLIVDTQWTLISISLLMIPGIPLVNAFRNLICGHEFNGILQLLNVFLESASLAAGMYFAVILMGGAGAW
ncbi:MAG: threonine/serine exporter family protein [Solobacterium sp.]|nr:threonine/serine exporter family protein [Solobacterium sp.]